MADTPLERPESPEDLAGHRPREAVEAAWDILDRALARPSKGNRPSPLANPNVSSLVGMLRTLRDRSARPDQPPPSPEDARRFVDLALGLVAKLEDLG
jgi:hypothetical protein